jgi:hypothetical protein
MKKVWKKTFKSEAEVKEWKEHQQSLRQRPARLEKAKAYRERNEARIKASLKQPKVKNETERGSVRG